MGHGGDWWSDWVEAWGWTAPAAATMPDCSRDFLFQLLGNEIVGDKDERSKALFANVERGVGIFLQNCHSFLPIRQIDRTAYIAGW